MSVGVIYVTNTGNWIFRAMSYDITHDTDFNASVRAKLEKLTGANKIWN